MVFSIYLEGDNMADRIYSENEAEEFRKLFKNYTPNKFIVEDDSVFIACDQTPEISPVLLFKRNEDTQNWYRNLELESYDIKQFLRNALRLFEKEGKELSAHGLCEFLQDQMSTVGRGTNYGSL